MILAKIIGIMAVLLCLLFFAACYFDLKERSIYVGQFMVLGFVGVCIYLISMIAIPDNTIYATKQIISILHYDVKW